MALRPRISHVMTRDGFIWKDKRAGVCVRAWRGSAAVLLGRGGSGQKDITPS